MKKTTLTLATIGMFIFGAIAGASTRNNPNGYLVYVCGSYKVISEQEPWAAQAYDEDLGQIYVVDEYEATNLQKTKESYTTILRLRKGFGLYEAPNLFRLDLRDSFGFGNEGRSSIILQNLQTGEAIPCGGNAG